MPPCITTWRTRATRPAPFSSRCRSLVIAAVVGAIAACANEHDPLLPWPAAVESVAALATTAAPPEPFADAIDRILPALGRDAAAPVGAALAVLGATLRNPSADDAARERAALAVLNVLADVTNPLRADAADMDAMRLEIEALRPSSP